MRLGIASNLVYHGPKDWANQLKELGVGAVIFPLDCNAKKQDILDFAEAAKEADFVIAEVGIWRNVVDAKENQRKEAVDYAIRQLAMADMIGAKCCVNIAGACVGNQWDGAYRENFERVAWEKTVSSIQEIVDAVNPVHTKYGIEPMPWMIPTGPDEYLRLLQDIDRPAVGVHIDIVNMMNCPERFFYQERFMDECFTKLRGQILSCHLKDIRLRQEFTFQLEETYCGNGNLNIEHYAKLATMEQEDMPMIIEHLHTDKEYIDNLMYVQKKFGINIKNK